MLTLFFSRKENQAVPMVGLPMSAQYPTCLCVRWIFRALFTRHAGVYRLTLLIVVAELINRSSCASSFSS